MGDSADDLLTTLHIDEDRATYEEVTEALNGYYHARKSTIAERAKFNRRCQKPGEPVEQFMQDLHRLAKDCEYSELREQLIRDRIIVGVLDDSLSDRLQSRPDLTLADAVRLARQDEARKQDRVLVRGDKSSTNVDYVKTKTPKGKGKQADKYKQQSQPQEKACGWCGGARHQREKCPAKDKLCNRCQKKGHFTVVCRGSKTKRVQEIGEDLEVPFLGEMNGQGDYWSALIIVNGFPTEFKLDTGASVSVLSDQTPFLKTCELDKQSAKLIGPGGIPLTVIGTLRATLAYKNTSIQETMYVLRNQKASLLSKSACVALQIISRIDEISGVSHTSPNFKAEFPRLSKGLGRLNTDYHITPQPSAERSCLYTARKVPHPLLEEVKKELDSMLKQSMLCHQPSHSAY